MRIRWISNRFQVIRENLHIVLAFSPIGEGFRARCRQFPSIINCATIDWFSLSALGFIEFPSKND